MEGTRVCIVYGDTWVCIVYGETGVCIVYGDTWVCIVYGDTQQTRYIGPSWVQCPSHHWLKA